METLQWFIVGAMILVVIAIERAEKIIIKELRRIERGDPIKGED